jgi:hypothetical protein
MKKYIVLSVNDNVDYLYFTPLTCWAWRKFGWEPIVFYHRSKNTLEKQLLELMVFEKSGVKVVCLDSIDGYRSDTITQISRLYASWVVNEPSYLMTGDIDMIPLSDYWKPDPNKVTVYGHDLTGFGHFPICYIGGPDVYWSYFMNNIGHGVNESIKRDLDTLPQAKDPDFYKYWFSDQDLITERLKQYGTGKIDFINRGQGSHGYARGRVDRANGGWVFNQPELIDAHLMHQTHHSEEKTQKLYDLLHHVWPEEDFTWFKNYTDEFKKLAV